MNKIKIYSSGNIFAFIGLLLLSFTTFSCDELVEDGYRTTYADSDAILTVEPLGYEMGAVGEIVSYKITASSANEILSLIVESNQEFPSGAGYDVDTEGYEDPFADHVFGTMKQDITGFIVKYDYVIPEETSSSNLTFSLIDEQGKVSSAVSLTAVSSIKSYSDRSLYSKDGSNFDAFATINGVVYEDIKTNYMTESEDNMALQEKLDIIFYVNGSNSVICSPANRSLGLEVENETKFKILSTLTDEDFANATSASLVALTEADSIAYNGTSYVRVNAGDIIGFTTDFNAAQPLKTGLIKVNALHPTNIDRYEGTAYVMECDIVTQID